MLLTSLRNELDLCLRALWRWDAPGRLSPAQLERDRRLAEEVGEFLKGFRLPLCGAGRIVDIGAKNFFLAPVIRELWGRSPEIVGIEIDPYRRYSDWKTRAQYAKFHASRAGNARFIGGDFLAFHEPIAIGLLLNPFLTHRPLLSWGLPLRYLRPEAIFAHLARQLSSGGKVILSSPTEAELATGMRFAAGAGLREEGRHAWFPSERSLQTQARWGVLLSGRVPA